MNWNWFVIERWLAGFGVPKEDDDDGSDRLPQRLTSCYEGFVCKALLVRLNPPLLWVDRSRVQESFCRIQKTRWNRVVYLWTRGKQGSTPLRHRFSISFNFILLPMCFTLQVLMLNITCEYLFPSVVFLSFSHQAIWIYQNVTTLTSFLCTSILYLVPLFLFFWYYNLPNYSFICKSCF